jgi:NAD(P)-dependent dehydrogenase (short-subunit alcohol dehydrogenase family)
VKRFEEKIVVITGGGQGIGKSCAERFAAEGAKVAVFDIVKNRAEEVAEKLNGLGGYCDVADHECVHDSIQHVVDTYGRVDILIANAGIYRGGPLHEDLLEDWELVLDVNLTGTYLSCHAVAPFMIAQNSGSIVVMSSIAAKTSWPNSAAYSATKTGAIGLVRSVAMELGPYNVNCNAVCLGHADTEMLREVDKTVCEENGWEPGTYLQELIESNPMKRLGTAEETAALIAFLASDEARYINGQAIEIDGGRIMS